MQNNNTEHTYVLYPLCYPHGHSGDKEDQTGCARVENDNDRVGIILACQIHICTYTVSTLYMIHMGRMLVYSPSLLLLLMHRSNDREDDKKHDDNNNNDKK